MEQNHRTQKTPPVFYFLFSAILFQGLSGLAGGIGLITDPTGSSLSIPVEWLDGSPFESYFIPGLILFLALGVFPLYVSYGIWSCSAWAWPSALLVGLMLIIWIVVEILVIGYQPAPPLQLIYGILGFIIIALLLFPTLRQYMNEKAV
jgi:hypothetical protein